MRYCKQIKYYSHIADFDLWQGNMNMNKTIFILPKHIIHLKITDYGYCWHVSGYKVLKGKSKFIKEGLPGFPSKLSSLGSLEDTVLKETPMVKSSRSIGSSRPSFSKCPVYDSPTLSRYFTYFRSTASSSSSDIGRVTPAMLFRFAKNCPPAPLKQTKKRKQTDEQ